MLFCIICYSVNGCNLNDCITTESYESGKVKSEKCYKARHQYYYKEYYENGQVKFLSTFINEKIEGVSLSYFENGKIESRVSTKGGLQNGNCKYYYENGKLESDCMYKNGRNGKCNSYRKDGSLKAKLEHKDGKRHGTCYYYLKNGKIETINYCINDKTIYGKFYDYSKPKPSYTELFDAIVEILGDTTNLTSKAIEIRVSLPIPDSLVESEYSYFRYGLKPLYLKDSFLLDTEKEIKLYYDKPSLVIVKAESTQPQILYGYVYDKIGPKVYNPFSQKITFAE